MYKQLLGAALKRTAQEGGNLNDHFVGMLKKLNPKLFPKNSSLDPLGIYNFHKAIMDHHAKS